MSVDGPTLVDRAFQAVYALGHRALRPWWRLVQTPVEGAFVALWWEGKVLLIQNSYVDYRTVPGGGIRPGEPPEAAGARECLEEVGLDIEPSELNLALVHDQEWFGRPDRVWLFELVLKLSPEVLIDHREVVEARLVAPEVALAGPLFPAVRRYLELHQAEGQRL